MWELGIFFGRDLGARGVEDIAVGWRAMLVAANLKARKRGGSGIRFWRTPYDWATRLTEFSRVLNKLNNRRFRSAKGNPPPWLSW
jgi:hypothetical protein